MYDIVIFRSSTYCTDVRLSSHNIRILLLLYYYYTIITILFGLGIYIFGHFNVLYERLRVTTILCCPYRASVLSSVAASFYRATLCVNAVVSCRPVSVCPSVRL